MVPLLILLFPVRLRDRGCFLWKLHTAPRLSRLAVELDIEMTGMASSMQGWQRYSGLSGLFFSA